MELKHELNIVGWFAVYDVDGIDGKVICIYPKKEDIPIGLQLYSIRQITAKVDFTIEQIENALSKRCADIEMTHCKSNITL